MLMRMIRSAVTGKAVAPSGKRNVKVEPKASSSGCKSSGKRKTSSSQTSSSMAHINKASTSKAINRPLTAAQLKAEQLRKEKVYDKELDEYTVERVVDKFIKMNGVTQYKVKWLEHHQEENDWKNVHELTNSMKLVFKWERENNQKWLLKHYPYEHDQTLLNAQIRQEYLRLTAGDYRIKEKYGIANGLAWYLIERAEDGDQKVLCLKDGDPYYKKMNAEEIGHVMRPGSF